MRKKRFSFVSRRWQCEFFRFLPNYGEDQRSAAFKVLSGLLYRVALVTFQLRFTKRCFPGCDPALTSTWTGIHIKQFLPAWPVSVGTLPTTPLAKCVITYTSMAENGFQSRSRRHRQGVGALGLSIAFNQWRHYELK